MRIMQVGKLDTPQVALSAHPKEPKRSEKKNVKMCISFEMGDIQEIVERD